jgi:hypothetical protein
VFGAARFVPGLQQHPHLLDTGQQQLAINATTDIPVVGASTGQPVVVIVARAASLAKNTVDGTIAVSLVHAGGTTTALAVSNVLAGSSVNNFHASMYSGLMTAGDTAIRIVSATADGTTTAFYRACIWMKVTGSAVMSAGSSIAGGHPTQTGGPFPTSAVGGPMFVFSDTWSGSSAAKSVTWNQPNAGPTLPGIPWVAHTFPIAGSNYPIVVSLARGGPTATYQCIGSGTDWCDLTTKGAIVSWGET